jgi:hypothetical protein
VSLIAILPESHGGPHHISTSALTKWLCYCSLACLSPSLLPVTSLNMAPVTVWATSACLLPNCFGSFAIFSWADFPSHTSRAALLPVMCGVHLDLCFYLSNPALHYLFCFFLSCVLCNDRHLLLVVIPALGGQRHLKVSDRNVLGSLLWICFKTGSTERNVS